jgi:TRAP-type C4-dicarboxylate transport system permease large subunit
MNPRTARIHAALDLRLEPVERPVLGKASLGTGQSHRDASAAVTTLAPILLANLLPIARRLGVGPLHFGLVVALNRMVGLLHPPMGMVLFMLARVARRGVMRTRVAILPLPVPLPIGLVLLTGVTAVGMWRPQVMRFLNATRSST